MAAFLLSLETTTSAQPSAEVSFSLSKFGFHSLLSLKKAFSLVMMGFFLSFIMWGNSWADSKPQVLLKTSLGDMVLELNPERAPKTVENFIHYVKTGHYNATIFHRVIDGFMIQGGGFTPQMQEKPTGANIPNEADNGLLNEPGTVAMARRADPNSASAQFFINVNNNTFLNHRDNTPAGYGYAVFGKLVKGQEVLDKIRKVATKNLGPHQNVPVEPIVIKSAEVLP